MPYQKPSGPGSPRGLVRLPSRARLARAPAPAGAFAAAVNPSISAATPATMSQLRGLRARAHL
ncbi:MAG TPA: hypothetical protein VGI05_18860, partial [Streptosporangiaceae bacterium]